MLVEFKRISECSDGPIPITVPILGQTCLKMVDHLHNIRECLFIVVIENLVNTNRFCFTLDDNPVDFADAIGPAQFPVCIFADQDIGVLLFTQAFQPGRQVHTVTD